MFKIYQQSNQDQRLYPTISAIGAGQLCVSETWVYAQADSNSARITQYTFGEPLHIHRRERDMLYVQSQRDHYCGWIVASTLQQSDNISASHTTRYHSPITANADLKSPMLTTLPRDSLFTPDDQTDDYYHIPNLGWAHKQHIAHVSDHQTALTTAQTLLNSSYVWGGRGVAGLDCSALSQLCYRWAGQALPRDADLQAIYLRTHHQSISLANLQTGDLLYLPGHVMLASATDKVIHANGDFMRVIEEPLQTALKRYQHTLKQRYSLAIYRLKTWH